MSSVDTHIPVLEREALDALNLREGGVYADLTLGRAGHAQAICQRIGSEGRLYAFDRDRAAIDAAEAVFKGDTRVTLIHRDFAQFKYALSLHPDVTHIDGVLLDLGVSSPQLDNAERGFSFQRDGDLDMRMDTSQGESAAQWLARVDEADLVKVLFEFGEERFARRIARAIVVEREVTSINSTLQLAALVAKAIPKKDKNKHPATRTFQAIRIKVNQELDQISSVLPQIVEKLSEGGRLVVISFHSLEDRLVKRFIRDLSTPNLPPRHIPVSEEAYQTPLKALGRAIKPSADEVSKNPRARSSVLRVAQRTSLPYSAEVSHA